GIAVHAVPEHVENPAVVRCHYYTTRRVRLEDANRLTFIGIVCRQAKDMRGLEELALAFPIHRTVIIQLRQVLDPSQELLFLPLGLEGTSEVYPQRLALNLAQRADGSDDLGVALAEQEIAEEENS